ncbi:hypothetical protein GCM10022408_23580 [Hymenobacter fastidiosus]|uniref:Uncharacterized protein n=1 Tax=Hymenobacter fastidiosus TaxID=486264 RepID=A0ABP7SE54_9BACT
MSTFYARVMTAIMIFGPGQRVRHLSYRLRPLHGPGGGSGIGRSFGGAGAGGLPSGYCRTLGGALGYVGGSRTVGSRFSGRRRTCGGVYRRSGTGGGGLRARGLAGLDFSQSAL